MNLDKGKFAIMSNKILFSANTSWYIYNFRASLIKVLIEEGFEVYALAPWDEYVERLEKLGCKHIHINIDNKGKNPFKEIFTIFDYYKIYKKLNPVVILNFTPKPNIYGSIAAKFLEIKCVNNIAGLGTAFINSGFLSKVVKILYRYSQKNVYRVFFQNSDDMEMFISSNIVKEDQADLLPGSGVELDKFKPQNAQQNGNGVRFVLIARLIWDKGVGEFAGAAEIVKKQYPDAEFDLIGHIDNNNPSAVSEEKIKEWESNDILKWHGRQDDVRPFIAKADCVVLPSYYREGTPRTLLEAASMAKPLIAADTIGCREPVEDGITGFLCMPKDANDLAEKMIKIIEMSHDDRVKMGKRGRKKMEAEYDSNIVINKYLEIIQKSIKQSKTL